MMKDGLTITEAAKKFGVDKGTVYEWVWRDLIPHKSPTEKRPGRGTQPKFVIPHDAERPVFKRYWHGGETCTEKEAWLLRELWRVRPVTCNITTVAKALGVSKQRVSQCLLENRSPRFSKPMHDTALKLVLDEFRKQRTQADALLAELEK